LVRLLVDPSKIDFLELVSSKLDNYYLYYVDSINTATPRISIVADPFSGKHFAVRPTIYIVEGKRK